MKLFDRLNTFGRSTGADDPGARPAPIPIPRITSGPATAEVLAVERRITELTDEITQVEADIEASAVRQHAADTAVRDLTEQAAAGTLEDHSRLVRALRQQREMSADDGALAKLDRLRAERNQLQDGVHTLRRKAAQEAYEQAVEAYAKACSPLVKLAQVVRAAAVDAGVLLSEHNSKHLIGSWVQIGGAVINLPKD
ncbi:hypothetical protein GALL_259540 [mine drainage metagenome]|uniref:Chromosome partition protein Smc n=1 Tax=mine drainage metagenome TaxID=410659 RepID=A0A1J5RVK3_9ZZZZ